MSRMHSGHIMQKHSCSVSPTTWMNEYTIASSVSHFRHQRHLTPSFPKTELLKHDLDLVVQVGYLYVPALMYSIVELIEFVKG